MLAVAKMNHDVSLLFRLSSQYLIRTVSKMIKELLQTNDDYICLFLRMIAGIIIFPYGMQKLFGWFEDLGGGVGIKETIAQMKKKGIPIAISILVIMGQSIGSVLLIVGCLGRIAAGANFIIFFGALIVHAKDGWTMNWAGKRKGEGVEYFILLLSILLVVLFKGSGAISLDFWLKSML